MEQKDHKNEHFHTHADGHTHTHPHTHPHVHEVENGAEDYDKVKALLSYMIHHNEHHVEELADLMEQLPPTAQKRLKAAIGTFEVANVELQTVLECLQGFAGFL